MSPIVPAVGRIDFNESHDLGHFEEHTFEKQQDETDVSYRQDESQSFIGELPTDAKFRTITVFGFPPEMALEITQRVRAPVIHHQLMLLLCFCLVSFKSMARSRPIGVKGTGWTSASRRY